MTRFDNVGGSLSGVFVSGMRPTWLVASAGALQAHPYLCDGPVLSMTPFHNNSCIRVRAETPAPPPFLSCRVPPSCSSWLFCTQCCPFLRQSPPPPPPPFGFPLHLPLHLT